MRAFKVMLLAVSALVFIPVTAVIAGTGAGSTALYTGMTLSIALLAASMFAALVPPALRTTARPTIAATHFPAVIYAIGDVHGCLDQLQHLERAIIADGAAYPGEKWLVMLGDYVDRGPAIVDVITHLMADPPTGFVRHCLAGNHEAWMLGYIDDPTPTSPWLDYGGVETLASYGIDAHELPTLTAAERSALLARHIPAHHIDWLRALPTLLTVPGAIFVHAGLRPDVPLERQTERDLLWIREPFLSHHPAHGPRVIHGHTPSPMPVVTPGRIGIDTGCCFTGTLTAVRLLPSGEFGFLDSTLHG